MRVRVYLWVHEHVADGHADSRLFEISQNCHPGVNYMYVKTYMLRNDPLLVLQVVVRRDPRAAPEEPGESSDANYHCQLVISLEADVGNKPQAFFDASRQIGNLLEVCPPWNLSGISSRDVLQLFTKLFLNGWVGENVVRDERQRAGSCDRSSGQETKRFALQAGRLFFRLGKVTLQDMMEHGSFISIFKLILA